MRILPVIAVISLAIVASVGADDAQPKAATFAVYPIATELQRFSLARSGEEAPRLRAYVTVSGNDLIDGEGEAKLQALPTEDISKALAPYADRGDGIVTLNMHFGSEAIGRLGSPVKAADEQLSSALEKLGRYAGFKAVNVRSQHGGAMLEEKLGTVTEKVKGRADEGEDPSGDELVTVYPVRTILSLLLTDNADCVVVIRAPLEKDGDKLLSPDVREAIVKHVAAVKLRDKAKLQMSVKTRGDRISDARFGDFYRVEVTDLAKSLGFASASVQSSRVR